MLSAFSFIFFISGLLCITKGCFWTLVSPPFFQRALTTLSCAFSALDFNSRPNSKDFPSKTKVFVTNITKSIDGTSAPLFLERQILFLILLCQIHRTTEVIFQPLFFTNMADWRVNFSWFDIKLTIRKCYNRAIIKN